MTNRAVAMVQTMFGAFAKGDIEGITQTVAEKSTWTYHGTNEIPYAGESTGKKEADRFSQTTFDQMDILNFQIDQFIADDVMIGLYK